MKKIFLFILAFAMFIAWTPIQESSAAWRNQVDIGVIDLEGETISGVSTLLRDTDGNKLLARGTTVPTDASSGYAKGGLFIDTDVVTGLSGLYENQGTSTSSVFVLVGDISDTVYAIDGTPNLKISRTTFDFAVDGGSHNTVYDMGVDLPDNAVITRAWYEVITTFQSGGTDAVAMSIGLPTDDANGIVAFTSISSDVGDVWDAGYHEAIQTGTAANFSTKTTAARAVTFSISSSAAGDLTAGKLVLFLEYVISD